MKNQKPITPDALGGFEASYTSCPHKQAMTHVFAKTNLSELAFNPVEAKKMQFRFSVDNKTMSATNQKSSGRCWLFAATNVLREIVAKKKNLDKFELSQSYLAFWDKFERVNYFLDSIIDTASLPDGDRTVDFILQTGVHDGGQWDMFVNIVRKYGIVPKDAMPETYQSSNTGKLNQFLNCYLKRVACDLRRMIASCASEDEIESKRKEALDKAFSFLCECYTLPPKEFDFEYVDKDGNYHLEKGYTPESFRKEMIGDMLEDYVSIINAPTKDKPFDKVYTVAYLGNISGAKEIRYLNLEMNEFKAAVQKQLEDGEIVWFGSDCGKCGDGEKKAWDDKSYDYTALVGFDFTMTKEESLDYHVSQMNHAMVLTGVNVEDGKPNRWKIENSWGSDGANGGYHMASDSWFDRYVFQAVVHKKYLGDKVQILEEEPTVLLPWDPMGSLAD
ncbi:MAG: aminopeptidase C [Eubacteriales bacterium]